MTIGSIKCVECKQNFSINKNTYLYNFNVWSNDQKKKMDIYDLEGDFFN